MAPSTPMAPTIADPRASEYGRAGGPWNDQTLDALLRVPSATRLLSAVDDDISGAGGTITWASSELEDEVARVAGGLADRGVGRGDVVAWAAAPSLASAVVYRACWRLGATAAPIHHRSSARERDALVGRLDPKVVVDLDDLVAGPPVVDDAAQAGDIAAVLFTSGSSGPPKGVLHTHRTLAYKARSMIDVHGLTPDDTILMPAPLAHISGLLNGLLLPGAVPMHSVLMARWDPERAIDLIERHRVTFMVGPPTFFIGILQASTFSASRVASLRLVSSGGAGVTPAFVEEASARLGCVVKRTYGSTEAPTVATSRDGDEQARLINYDGRSTGLAELRVVDPDTGDEKPRNSVGELWVRGPELFRGYLDERDNDGCFVDGWFRTGDLATLDAGGWLTITGRLKDVIIRGGENIAVAEIEQTLEAHSSVVHAVAVGEPDDRLGERVVAVVVTSGPFDLDRCRDWFERRGVARYKTPERVVCVDTLPTLPSGKPDRRAVRDQVVGRTRGPAPA